MSTDVSPLAQRLAEAYGVDLTTLREKYLDKITARNVLEHLNTVSGDRPSPKRKRLKPAAQSGPAEPDKGTGKGAEQTSAQPVADTKPTLTPVTTPNQGDPAMSETLSETRPEPESVQPTPKQPVRADDPALAQTRAQLQATAKVHQQALLEVGSLRQQNSALDTELERLRVLEAQARADLETLAQGKRQLERELERSKRTVKPLSWLRKLVS